MPRTKGDGRYLYISRKRRLSVQLTDREWAEIADQSQIISPPQIFTNELREDLNDAIDIFAKCGPSAMRAVPISEVNKKFGAWTRRTNKLRGEFSKSVLPLAAENVRTKQILLTGNPGLEDLLRKYFEENRYAAERLTADDLVFMMEGLVKFTNSILYRIEKTSSRRIEQIDFWLIWAALLISILRKHKIPFARKTKSGKNLQEFRAEVIDFIHLVQRKVPHLGWARREHNSIRLALKHVLPFARKAYIPALKKILRLWSVGQFDAYEHKKLMRLHGVDFKAKRILGYFGDVKISLQTSNRNGAKKSNSDLGGAP
jgi:hypothetical protein